MAGPEEKSFSAEKGWVHTHPNSRQLQNRRRGGLRDDEMSIVFNPLHYEGERDGPSDIVSPESELPIMTPSAVHRMGFGKAATYALVALIHLAEQPNDLPIQGREIAAARKVPFGYLLKILQQLVRRQILASQVGRSGGFRLIRSASEISVLEVIEAVDGHLVASTNSEDRSLLSPHALSQIETVHNLIAKTTREFLSRITIADLTSATTHMHQ